MKPLLFIFLLFSAPFLGNGQMSPDKLGTITGKIMDKSLQQPMPNATVVIETCSGEIVTKAISDEDGTFTIKKIPYGTYDLTVRYIGYENLKKEVKISTKDQKVKLGVLHLDPSVIELERVVVTAKRLPR